MNENHSQLLSTNFNIDQQLSSLPDAIYIPFHSRYRNLNKLLEELKFYPGPIYILPSPQTNVLKIFPFQNICLLQYWNIDVTESILHLKTFKLRSNIQDVKGWDLPLKRNIALIHSVQKGYNAIMIIDDDITSITENIVAKATYVLKTNNIVGCLIEGYSDTSVIGHIAEENGEVYFPFVSGSFLFINPIKVEGFFPLIYNEDWIFMIPSILEHKIQVVGRIQQKEYDPFSNLKRIKQQEFGEIIAEGLYELIHKSSYSKRFNNTFWADSINTRKSYVNDLLLKNKIPFRDTFLKESLKIAGKITPNNCKEFIEELEEDIILFKKLKNL